VLAAGLPGFAARTVPVCYMITPIQHDPHTSGASLIAWGAASILSVKMIIRRAGLVENAPITGCRRFYNKGCPGQEQRN
jgi:hypothetical protein